LKLNSLIDNKIICFENVLERSHRRQLIEVLLITCLCEKDDMDNDEYCEGFLSEIQNWNQILLFSRE